MLDNLEYTAPPTLTLPYTVYLFVGNVCPTEYEIYDIRTQQPFSEDLTADNMADIDKDISTSASATDRNVYFGADVRLLCVCSES